jgi:phosphoglycolate/pyridoxal phosphate phosphatase family enzyme
MILAQAFARFLLDLDGVVWRGDKPIAGAPETIRTLRDAGKTVCFMTNNSSRTAESYAKALTEMGSPTHPDDVITSADAVARVLERSVPGMRGRLVLVLGGEGLRDAVTSVGGRVAEPHEGTDASVVVVGLDRSLTFESLRTATLAIRAGATFVASNTDATFPAPEGLWPGAGALVAALRTSTGVEPIVAGKPQTTMLEIATERVGGGGALAVGDRVDTDVAGARAAGWPSALVLTGVTGIPDLAVAHAWPDFVIGRLSDLLEDRPHPSVRAIVGADLPHVAGLLHAGGLRSGALRERTGKTLVAEIDRVVVATAGWEAIDDVALLRSVAVSPDARRAGIGRVLVAATLRKIVAAGIKDVYLVTEHAEAFFAACGFIRIERDVLPDGIASHRQVVQECPIDAATMHLRLPDPQ